MKINPILACDFYKTGHFPMWPKGTEYVYSNFTPRSGKLAPKHTDVFDDTVVFFGMQGFMQWFLIDTFNDEFFKQPKDKIITKYVNTMKKSLCLDTFDATHIEALHDLGYLPIEIKALPEGSCVPMKVPMFTVTNTVAGFGWLVGYLEDMFSCETWKSCTTASTSMQYRKLLEKYALETGASMDFVVWQGHDFSMRGQSGVHDAASSCSGHLLSFLGTDTIPAIQYLEDYYAGGDTFVGGSVAASEHSVTCAGLQENEQETIRRIIVDEYPSGVVSIVSDSWDYYNTLTVIAKNLKQDILDRKPNAIGLSKTVFRPDSGDPVDIICGFKWITEAELCMSEWGAHDNNYQAVKVGDEYFELEAKYDQYDGSFDGFVYSNKLSEAEVKGSIEVLWDIFGGSVNALGFKELNPKVGLIYGDSITLNRANDILKKLKDKGFASSNVVFGIGSYSLQYVTRDSYGFAMKATSCEVNGTQREIFKDPITSDGTKKSAKGLLRVELENGVYVMYDQQTKEQEASGVLQTVFKDGQITKFQTLEEIRKVLWK
jgi:nicotinamide phosphoribosyltransferase